MENSEFLYHAPCIECGSKNNVAVYSDLHGHCFGCGHYYSTYEKQEVAMETTNKELVQGECKPLIKRKINKETACFIMFIFLRY